MTNAINMYSFLLSFSLRNSLDNKIETMLYEAIKGAAIMAFWDIANT